VKRRLKIPNPAPQRSAPREPPRPLPPGRLWLFRIAALLLPVVLVGLVELALRIGGYGYATSFFHETRVGGQEFLVNNDTFTLRFFPPELARWPEPFMIPAAKPPDTVRIFVFGESAAMGDPQPAYGASRYLEVLLRERFPDRKFEIINTSITAVNSHVILPIARECAAREGDVWIVYMGNNEMVGPFGAATIFGSQSPPLPLVRLNLAVQKMRVGQLAMATLRKLRGPSTNATWEGMRMFMQNQIPPDDPRRASAYRNFEANLRDILRAGLGSGAKVILNSMSVNLKDCPPFASLSDRHRPADDQTRFGKLYAEARAQEQAGDDLAAAQTFERAARLDAKFAELQYRWADCLRRTSNATARTHYQLACDADALPFRADTQINGIIRRVGGEFAGRGLVLSDAESALANASPLGIPGQEVFFEHVHFNFRGNYLLGRLWAEQVARSLPATPTATHPPSPLASARSRGSEAETDAHEWASQEICERDLGLTLWNRGFVMDLVIERMQRPPLNHQFNNPARLAGFQAERETLRLQQASTNAIFRSGEELLRAIQRAPQDPYLHAGLANLYEALGDLKRAVGAYQKMVDLLPHDFYGKLQLGRLQGELGRPAEGEPLLQQAARQRPSIPDVWTELGNVCMAQKKYAQALEAYQRAALRKPREASYVSCVALALAKLNRRAEAIATYRRAIQMRSDFWEAHFELAGELVADHQLEEAAREYTEAIRLNSRHAVSRINLGVVLFRQNRLDEAIKQFEAALQIEPTNAAAVDYLRQVTDRRNRKP
jgi:tetratricopeptide (TPR) repeat protein